MKPYSIDHHQRLNPKKESTFGKSSKGSFGKKRNIIKKKPIATESDREYLGWFNEQGLSCMVCGCTNGVQGHHVKRDSTDKKDHKRVIPLCVDHHLNSMELSAHGTPKKFREEYPMEYQHKLADKIYSVFESLT